jgi:hypothetical protein
MPAKKQLDSERATYLGLIATFWSVFGVVALLRRDSPRTKPTPLDFVMLGLATFRLGRVIAFDKVGEPLRAPFTRTVPDDSGAGDTVVAAGRGPRVAIGELLSCPICAGTWIAAGLVYGLQVLPGPTRLLISIMSATGMAEVLNAATEAMTWLGQAERQDVGKSSSKPHAKK